MKSKYFVYLIILIFFSAYLFSCSKSLNDNSDFGNVGCFGCGTDFTNWITIKDYAFIPDTLTVKKGETVTWNNYDLVDHLIISDDSITFKSDIIHKNGSFEYKATVVGIFKYHSFSDSKGVLIVNP